MFSMTKFKMLQNLIYLVFNIKDFNILTNNNNIWYNYKQYHCRNTLLVYQELLLHYCGEGAENNQHKPTI